MASDAPCRALLVEGPAPTESASLIGVGEALRASGVPWSVQRLSCVAAGEHRLDELALHQELDLVAASAAPCALIVISGAVVHHDGEPRLAIMRRRGRVVEARSLEAIGAALDRIRADQHIIIAVTSGDLTSAEIAARLATSAGTVIAAITTSPQEVIDTLVRGLRGAARDAVRGVLTAASLATYLAAAHAVEVRLPPEEHRHRPWFEPPSLERLWRLGWSIREPGSQPPAPTANDGDPLVGTILPGRFRLEALIATGGFGHVYRARQLAVDRDVAVKVLRPGIDPFSEDGRLFVHEIQAVARIDHQNVVRVYQADVTADGRLFFAMELLAGQDLQALAASAGPIESARAVALVRQLLRALEAAHRVGLVHADVKPENAIVVGSPSGERLVLADFGLSRLRRHDETTRSVGGTPAFMAPEQLRAGRVDARSDQFAAALVLVVLLCGWRRQSADELIPPAIALEQIRDPAVRAAVSRAVSLDPEARFPSVAAFAAALEGAQAAAEPLPPRPPFHGLAPFTEDDRGQLHGRDRELTQLTELVLYRRLVIVTAPSGTGKTSLLRAGLVPRLDALGTKARYASCRTDDEAAVAQRLTPGAETLAAALTDRDDGRPAAVVIDQAEAALEAPVGSAPRALLDAIAAWVAAPPSGSHLVLSVREDFLARLLHQLPERGAAAPIVRVGPLDLDGARAAIVRPLAERRLAVEPALLERLLADLAAAGARLGAEFGWAAPHPVYPPHLQLACSVLHDRLPGGDSTLSLAHYRALGGLDAIVGEHLERVLDDLTPAEAATARELFLALVTSAQSRSARTEAELAESLGGGALDRLPEILEVLRRQGLIVRSRRAGGELVWELVHDSLVPRVLAWIDRRDLSRRRAIEMLRHHLRRSRPDAPSLLSRAELRELRQHTAAIATLQAEWRPANADDAAARWTPQALIARSRLIHRRSTIALAALGVTVIAGVGAAVNERRGAAAERQAEAERRDQDLGLATLELAPFDWDAASGRALPVSIGELPSLGWTLHAPSYEDPGEPGDELARERVRRFGAQIGEGGGVRFDPIEAPGGAAFLVITGRGRASEACAPSIVPLRALPGYTRRGAGSQPLRIRIPTCRASQAGTIEVPAGPFWFGGPGDPPSPYQREFPERATEQRTHLPAFRVDRTEVTNAAFSIFSSMREVTGIAHPPYIPTPDLASAAAPSSPVSAVTWREATAYCKFLGKALPSSQQWEKAMRGGLTIEGRDNPVPRRNFPWGLTLAAHQANLSDEAPKGPRSVGAFATDRSPYGVLDLAGNVAEWIGSAPTGYPDPAAFFREGWRMTRGGNWSETPSHDLVNFVPIENARVGDTRTFTIGVRCASAL